MHFVLTEENTSAVADICARLDGLPLAIELVAARIKMLPPKALLARLQAGEPDSRLDLVSDGARDLPDRHRTLADTIGWSYSLLSSDEQTLFRRLSVFTGGFTLPAAAAICNANSDLSFDLFAGISQLLQKNLVTRETAESGGNEVEPRFAMLETIHAYAYNLLKASGEERKLKILHTEYFLAVAAALPAGSLRSDEALV